MFIKLLSRFYDTLFPRCCVFCGDFSYCDRDLCCACEKDLPKLSNPCEQCALPLPTDNINSKLCGQCLKSPPPYDCTLSVFEYEAPLPRLVSSLKFHHQLSYAKLFADLLLEKLTAHYENTQRWPEIIIPVPLHPKRLRQRGFNQALEIAKPLAKQLKISLDISHCHRVIATAPQTTLSADQRMHNVHRAFKAETLSAQHVAVVDDVITTGHTIREFSRTLRKAGVSQIDIWCCARTTIQKKA